MATMTIEAGQALLANAVYAEEVFQAALVAAYGKRHASTFRYHYTHPGHPEVEAAGNAYKAAAAAWIDACKEYQANR